MSANIKTMAAENVAVVTGSNKGLGFSIIKALCEKYNGTVYLTSRNEKLGKEAHDKLKNIYKQLKYHQLDVSDEESIKNFCSYLNTNHLKIDLLINNAGILFLKDAIEPKEYQAERTVHINFFSLVNFTEALLPFIKNNSTILNISSSSGHLSRIPSTEIRRRISDPNLSVEDLKKIMNEYVKSVKQNSEVLDGWGEAPYVVSKVGVNAYTFILNRILADRGIIVNCVHPGYVKSDMTRGSGSVSPDEAALLVWNVLEAKEGGSYFWHTGEKVPWDGPDPRGYIDNKNQ